MQQRKISMSKFASDYAHIFTYKQNGFYAALNPNNVHFFQVCLKTAKILHTWVFLINPLLKTIYIQTQRCLEGYPNFWIDTIVLFKFKNFIYEFND